LMFTAGLSFFIKPSKEASVTILSYTEVIDLVGDYWVFGEVQNLGTTTIEFVEINATFYDTSNTLIAEGHGFCDLYYILPNRKSPFYVSVDVADETQASKIDHYTFEITPFSPFSDYSPSTPPLGLKILSSNAEIDMWSGWMNVTGEIENVGTTNASCISVYGTCYDSDGKVLDVGIGVVNYSAPYSLLPGQKASFDLMFNADVVPLAKSYVITAESIEYACFEYPELPTPAPSTPSVAILSYSAVNELGGDYYVYGEVQNLGTTPLYLEINGLFYDSSNTLIAEGHDASCLTHILPDRKSPFIVVVDVADETQASKIDHFTLEASPIPGPSATPLPLGLKILSSNASLDSITDNLVTITGEIENTGTASITSNVYIWATFYDSNGNVIYVNCDILDPMLPGQKASFRTWFVLDSGTMSNSYVLTAESKEYACFEYPELPTPAPSQTPEVPSDTSVPPIEASTPTLDTTVWVAPPENAAIATTVTVVAVGAASVVAAAVSNTAGMPTGRVVQKTSELLPESLKKWLSDYISSKRESTVEGKTGSFFVPTKSEVLAYGVSLAVLTLSFSYVKANDLTQILSILPNILLSAIIIEFVKTFALEVFARSRGVWTEHKIWYLGLTMFLVTTFALGIPFSSPSRNVYHTTKLTKRLQGIVSSFAILVVLAFAALFFVLMISGFVLIGSTGLAMCSILAFLDTFPVAPMNGKAIYEYSKILWVVLFAVTLTLYGSWLILL
jgi:hypothetical protein